MPPHYVHNTQLKINVTSFYYLGTDDPTGNYVGQAGATGNIIVLRRDSRYYVTTNTSSPQKES